MTDTKKTAAKKTASKKTNTKKDTTPNASTEAKGTTEMTTPKNTTAKTKGNGYQLRDVKLADMETVHLTQEEFNALDNEGIWDAIYKDDNNRLSRERALTELVTRVREGRVNTVSAEALMNWTYRAVQVEGVEHEGNGRTPEKASVKLTQEEFDALDNVAIAGYLNTHANKRSVADSVLPELIKAGLIMSAEDVVYLTNGRVEIEGVTVKSTSKKSTAVVDGVTFS